MNIFQTHHTNTGDVQDVVIIGAGINGIAVARELATHGLRVTLFEQDDIGSKTSSISTRLIHGGLKYLEKLEVKLVMESIRERGNLLNDAPHLVHEYPMFIPFIKKQSRPGWLLASGLKFYDLLSFRKKNKLSKLMGRKKIEEFWPGAHPQIRSGGLFFDANVPFTERLCMEIAISAHLHGARIFTHTPVTGIAQGNDGSLTVSYRDREQGTTQTVQTKLVLNIAGPWVDRVLGIENPEEKMMGPTKGSHLVVDPFPGAPTKCIFFESPDDTRPMFILPWNNRYMIGTTDIPYDEDIDNIIVTQSEVDYLLRGANSVISGHSLTPDDVLWTYSGVRPLPNTDTDNPATISREHSFIEHRGKHAGIISVIGGKLTTHRDLAEQLARKVFHRLGKSNFKSRTRGLAFPGKPASAPEFERTIRAISKEIGLPDNSVERLKSLYGNFAFKILEYAAQDNSLAQVIDEDTHAIGAEIVYAVKDEAAHTITDILMRRTAIVTNKYLGQNTLEHVSSILSKHLGWTQQAIDLQVEEYKQELIRFQVSAQ